jgi:uncharacterized membrane protein YfcA
MPIALVWFVGAAVIFAAHVVFGLAGFGVSLVAMAFLPFIMAPATAVVLMTIYATIFAVVVFVPLRREFALRSIAGLTVGSLVGTPLGVWVLASAPPGVLNRAIGLMLVGVVTLEFAGRLPRRLDGPAWGVGAGVLSGLTGGAVGLPGPPAVAYATTQSWGTRTFKANLQAFFIVNQGAILLGYWLAGLVDGNVVRLTGAYVLPALAGTVVGMRLFDHVDPVRFRRIVFALLLVSGVVLFVSG